MYAEFHPRIVRYLVRLIGADEAEDAAQEAFAKIHSALPEFRGESQLSTWVYRIATNTAMDRVRSAAYRYSLHSVPIGEPGESESTCADVPSPDCTAERQTIREEMSECVQDLVKKLPEDYQVVLALSEVEDLKDREIAEVLGVTLEAVKIRLHRARAKMRALLESQCSFYRDGENTLLCDIKKAPPQS